MIRFRSNGGDVIGTGRITMIRANTRTEMRHALHTIGYRHKKSADDAILGRTERKRGRLYRIKGRRRRHRASAPGQSHANLSGLLRRSNGWRVRGSLQLEFGYGLANDAPDYAAFVERGTSKMEARSSLLNAVTAERRNTMREIRQHADAALVF